MTTLRQKLVRKKNRKLRRVLELYPDLRVKLFYARDFRALMLKFGKLALVDELSGTPGQVVPERPRGRDRRMSPAARSTRPAGRSGRPGRSGRRWAATMTRPIDLVADIGEVLVTEDGRSRRRSPSSGRGSAPTTPTDR